MKIFPSLPNNAYASLLRNRDAQSKAAAVRQTTGDPQQKQLNERQEALARLKAMPSPKALARQAAASRVEMLKRRLAALKAMLLNASPELAKALASQLKSIAKELAAVAKDAGGGGGQTPAAVGTSITPNLGAAEVPENSASASPDTATATATAGADDATPGTESPGTGDDKDAGDNKNTAGAPADAVANPDPGQARDKPAAEGNDKALKNALVEAKRLLKEVIAMIKSKIVAGDREARQDVWSAEKSLAEIDHVLASDGGNALYSTMGNLSVNASVDASAEIAAGSGGSISVSV